MASRAATLWKIMAGQRLLYGLAIAFMVGAVVVSYGTPMIVRVTIDSIINAEPFNLPPSVLRVIEAVGGRSVLARNLWVGGLLVTLLAVISGVLTYFRGRWSAKASERIIRNLRNCVYDHLQHLPVSFYDKAETGDLVQRCTGDMEMIHQFLTEQLVDVGRSIMMVLVAVPVMLWMDPVMALLGMALVPVIILFTVVYFLKVRASFQIREEAEARMTTTLQENLTGIRVVRAFCRGEHEKGKFAAVNDDYRDRDYRVIRLMAWYWPVSSLLCFAQRGIVLFVGGWWAMDGRMLPGELTAFFMVVNMFIWPVRRIGTTLTELSKTLVSVSRLAEILDRPREDAADPTAAVAAHPAAAQGRVVFNNVAFAHGEKHVLRGVSFEIEPGQTLAILGPSGAGKSTIVNLLMRFYEADAGTIHVDGRDTSRMHRHELRRRIGVVMQEPFLYSKSLRENIGLGNVRASEGDIVSAAQTACLDASVEGFKQGYDTLVGERGVTLSGGQRQRVALARALLKKPPILILDDALSAVDTQTEAMIVRALRSRHGRQTTIVIAHRLSTLQWADRILVLEGGRILQQGTHESLLAAEGMYRRLWEIQNQIDAGLLQKFQAAPAERDAP